MIYIAVRIEAGKGRYDSGGSVTTAASKCSASGQKKPFRSEHAVVMGEDLFTIKIEKWENELSMSGQKWSRNIVTSQKRMIRGKTG